MRRFAPVLARVGVALVVACAAVGLTATPAVAHATLLSSTPAQSSAYPTGAPPTSVSLVFDAAVNATPASVNVYDGGGRAVGVVAPRASVTSKRITVSLPRLADGSYVVVWHIVSDDGHPEQGAFTFSVGAGGVTTTDVASLVARQSSGRGIGFGFGVDRALAFLGCLVLVGGVVFTSWFWPDGLARREVRGLLLSAALVAIVATALSVPLQAAYTTVGGLSKSLNGSALHHILSTRFGAGARARAALLLGLVYFVLRPRTRAPSAVRHVSQGLVALLGIGVWATFAYAGHGNTGRLVALGFVTDVAHLSAASLWLGGLLVLAFALRDRQPREVNARAAARFSTVGLPAIGVVVVSGAIQGWRQIDTWWAVWHTDYGRLLVVKVILVLAIVIVASGSRDLVRDRMVPGLRAAVHHRPPALAFQEEGVAELRNGVWVEVLLAVVVLAVTATLVVTAPGREAQAAAKRPVARTVHLDTVGPRLGYSILVQPALPGENTIVVTPRLLRQTGFLPFTLSAEVRSPRKVAPIRVTFTPLEDGRWVAAAPLSQAGTWKLDVTGETNPTSDTASVQLHIG